MLRDKENIENDDENVLWKNFLAGNDDAFSKIYEKLIHNLFSFGTTLTNDNELVKDCIQDVFIRLYQNREQLTSVKNIKIYVMIALKNALKDAFKKNQTYQKFIDLYDIEKQTEDSEEDRIIEQESEMDVQNKVAKYKSILPARQQEIIHLRFVEELTIEEIAKLLNINYQSVANSIQKSLQKIRKFYFNF